MNILITGCSGFIGFHLSKYLLENTNHKIFGIDNLNNYYDVDLKKNRLKILKGIKNRKSSFVFYKIDIKNNSLLKKNFLKNKYNIVVHLAAQAGVRYSILDPSTYFENNIQGFFNILETSRIFKVKHLLFASTSSVYGNNKNFPLKEDFNTDKPLSFYAASKKTNEVMAYSYSNIYKMSLTGMRFFTVYGPYGRPDMFLFKYVKSIFLKQKISIYNHGKHERDFTYVSDVVESIFRLISKPSKGNVPFQVLNIGNGKPEKLFSFMRTIEKFLNKKANTSLIKMQKGDVGKTHADISNLKKKISYKPKIKTIDGINKFITWYKQYY